MAIATSPLAVALPELPPLAGVRLGSAEAGIRYKGRRDLVMVELAPGTTVAGVFTSSKCPGAPVDWCRASLPAGRARALVVNAGNANVFTGRAGAAAAKASAAAAAALVGCPAKQVFLASTGVIGEVLPHDKLTAALPALHARLSRSFVGGCRPRHHDHRHLSEGGDPDRPHRRRRGADHRHRQGQRHDRARHGDHAVLRLHRREDPGAGAAEAAEKRRRPQLQLHHRGQRHLHLRHRPAVRHRPGEAPADRGGRGPRGISPGRWTTCCWTSLCR